MKEQGFRWRRVFSKVWVQLAVFLIFYGLGWILAVTGHDLFSGISLILLGIYLFAANYLRTGLLIDFRSLLSLSWIGGMGIACLKLSKLSTDWSSVTWIAFGLAYLCFWAGYEIRIGKKKSAEEFISGIKNKVEIMQDTTVRKRLLISVILVTAVSAAAFLLEALVLGFIPILSDKPHAYSYFHISGVHYFTVCFTFVPSLFLIYHKVCRDSGGKVHAAAWICLGVSLLLPILCVSRFQLIFAVLLGIMTYLILYPHVKIRYAVIMILALIPVYVLLTVFRHHDVAYLNGIFEMKNADTPIFVTQPYMYVANNFENFNCLVRDLPAHTYGIRMLFPVLALSGLKFAFPQLVSFPLYITKTELTTLTWIYDFYYDFGLIGVAVFTFLIGLGCRWVKKSVLKNRNPVAALYYGQIGIYMCMSFFTTWFSNPTTWFWLVITTILYFYIGYKNPCNESERR